MSIYKILQRISLNRMLITLVILESQDYIRFVFSLRVLFSNFPGVNLFVCLILYFY